MNDWQTRSHLYHQLATLTDSGIAIRQAFSMLADAGSRRTYVAFNRAIAEIDSGNSLEDALRASQYFSELEMQLMSAGEKGGRLSEIFARLAEQYDKKAKRIRTILSRLAYPFVLIHAAILLPNLVLLVQGNSRAYLGIVLPLLGLVYGLALLPWFVALATRRSPATAISLEILLFQVPLLGNFLWKSRTAQALTVLHLLYRSGIPFLSSLSYVVKTMSCSALGPVFARIYKEMQGGATMQEALMTEPLLPKTVRDLMITGEISGRLDKTMKTACDMIEEEADVSMQSFIRVGAACIFIAIAAFVAYQIVNFYVGYFQRIGALIPPG